MYRGSSHYSNELKDFKHVLRLYSITYIFPTKQRSTGLDGHLSTIALKWIEIDLSGSIRFGFEGSFLV